jgi:hypothetical protein
MTAIQLAENDFGFRNQDIHLLASIRYWALRTEAVSSTSYSRMRKHFMNEESKAREQQAYRDAKHAWADEWYGLTSQLLELGDVIPSERLRDCLGRLGLSETKKAALCVELATFTGYYQLNKDAKDGDSLSFSDEDRKLYLRSCAEAMGESLYTLELAWQEFNRCIERIVKANTGPDLTWVWVGLGAAVLLVLAPYLAGAIGGFMGLGGAAATSAGLALLGGGSLAAGGFGMSGGYVVLMAGGAILGYGSGSTQYQQKLREGSKEELLFNCGKLFAASKVFALYDDDRIGICGKALLIQSDLEADADRAFLQGDADKGKQLDGKALVMRSFRGLLRGDLK